MCNSVVTGVNQTYCSDHFIICTNIGSLYCTPKTNIILYVNQSSVKMCFLDPHRKQKSMRNFQKWKDKFSAHFKRINWGRNKKPQKISGKILKVVDMILQLLSQETSKENNAHLPVEHVKMKPPVTECKVGEMYFVYRFECVRGN